MTLEPRVAVTTAEESRALDARTIATLPDSYTLMHRAASIAADWLDQQLWRSAAVYVGTGNNGGDGWVIAGLLRDRGWMITVHASGEPKSSDARRARREAERGGRFASPTGSEVVLVDAVLGTGAVGAPRDGALDALDAIRAQRSASSVVVAIDIPSALDADTGEDDGALAADVTLTFGSMKRGLLLRREIAGAIHVLDIGLVAADVTAPMLVSADAVRAWIPEMRSDAYKGTRGRLAIVGGASGMAGAVILAARGAEASGVGMVRADVAAASQLAVQVAVPSATVQTWHADWSGVDTDWPHAMVIGPGLDGSREELRAQVLALLGTFTGPVVLDAGALTAFRAGRAADGEDIEDAGGGPLAHLEALRHALRGREVLLTPHIGEFNTLINRVTTARSHVAPSLAARFDAPTALAAFLGATVLLKGVPTVITAPDGRRLVSAAGNQALAMGGTGDLLSGIAGALLAQGVPAFHAGAAAAWVHGTAAERAVQHHGSWRGVTMALLLRQVSNVWPLLVAHTSSPVHTVAALPAVPCR